MTIADRFTDVIYPDSDGKPMAETDFQRIYIVYATEVLRIFFQNQPQVYPSGNICFYYEEGNPRAYLSPDVFVVFGIEQKDRRSYKVWEEENKFPDFVLEITSRSTVTEDQGSKKGLYAFWGVREYFQYDPTGDYLEPSLQGLRLDAGVYRAIAPNTSKGTDFALLSETLGLELHLEAGELRFYNPATGEKLFSHAESEAARQQAELRAQIAADRVEQETQRADRLAAKLRELGIDPTAL